MSDRIDSIIDLSAVKQEVEQLKKMLDELKSAILDINSTKTLRDPRISMKEFQDASKQSREEAARVQKALKDVQDASDALEKAKAKVAKSMSDEAKEIVKYNEEVKKNNKSLREQVELEQAVVGSINEARAQVKVLISERNNLDLSTESNRKKQSELNKEIDKYNDFIKKNVDSLSRQKINIGNYTGAVKVLEQSLDEINQKIDDFNNSGNQNTEILAQMQKEQSLLQQLIDTSANGFANMSQELSAAEKALMDMHAAGMKDSKMFKQLQQEIIKAKKEMSEFKKEMSSKANLDILKGAISAAQTLTAVYGLAEGAAALFGVEAENLQKQMVKLQAVLTILNSLEIINNSLKSDGILLLTIQTVKTYALAAALKIYTYATTGATLATNVFRTALIATGFGAILLLITTAAQAMSNFGKETKATKEELTDFNKVVQELDKSFEGLARVVERNAKLDQERMKTSFEAEQKIMTNEIALLEERKRLAEANYKVKEKMYQNDVRFAGNVALIGAAMNAEQEKIDDINLELQTKRLELTRKNIEDMIKLRQNELAQNNITLELQADLFEKQASDETLSYTDRLRAAGDFAQKQKEINAINLQSQLLDPNLKNEPGKIALIKAEAAAKQEQIARELDERLKALRKEQIEREKVAQFEITRIGIETQMAANREIMEGQKFSLDERTKAAEKYHEDQVLIINAQRQLELDNEVLTESERLAINKTSDAAIEASKKEHVNRLKDILMSELDEESRIRIANNSKLRDEELDALNQRFHKGLMSRKKYAEERLKIERDFLIKELKLQIENTEKIIAEMKKRGEGIAEIEAQLAAFKERLSRESTKKEDDNIKTLTESIDKYGQMAMETYSAIANILTAGIDRQINAIQKQTEEIDKQKAAELDHINSSTLAEEEKAARIIIIEANANARKETLERKQRDLEMRKARFDKARAIMEATVQAAVATLKGLTEGGPVLAAIYGAIGAAQIAAAAAAVIPRYAIGTENSPEGPAIVGERGRELRIEPSGRMSFTPPRETLTWLKKGTKIIPHNEVDQYLLQAMMTDQANFIQEGRVVEADYHSNEKKFDEIRDAIYWLSGQFKSHIRGIRPPHIEIKDNRAWLEYIKRNIFD